MKTDKIKQEAEDDNDDEEVDDHDNEEDNDDNEEVNHNDDNEEDNGDEDEAMADQISIRYELHAMFLQSVLWIRIRSTRIRNF
jgi:hypothetical protein